MTAHSALAAFARPHLLVGAVTALTAFVLLASAASAEPLDLEGDAPPPAPAMATERVAAPASQSVAGILGVFGWSMDGLAQRIHERLTLPEIMSPAPAWAPAPTLRPDAAPPPASAASAVVIMDEASQAILLGREARTRMAPASLTKVATAALAVQSGRLDETVHNTVESWNMPGSSLMGLHAGDRFSLRDLVYGMMLPSGNDAALAIGRHLAGDDALFMHHLNQMLQRIGLQDTHFTDPHGLGGPDHYSSALDLALLSRYAMQMEEFRHVAAAHDWTAVGSRTISMSSYVAPFIDSVPGAEGLKTGFTKRAGPTFIGSAYRDGRRIYVVILNSGDRFGEAAAMIEWAFANYIWSDAKPVSGEPAEEDDVMRASRLE